MKNIINILLFYAFTAILNVWSLNGCVPDILWEGIIDYVETEENEREEQAKYDIFENQKNYLEGGNGRGDLDNEIITETIPQINTPLFNSLEPVAYSEENSLRQYHAELINSIAIPKLYILFRCPKTFLS